ncbi:MFS transporter, partial [Escherichia coli]|nr:MFS transporter [Escherichia coli]
RAGAIATMFMGLTIATIGGVPLATWAGEAFGWRAVFAAIAAIGVVTMAALRLFVPALPGQADADMGAELRVLGRSPVLF